MPLHLPLSSKVYAFGALLLALIASVLIFFSSQKQSLTIDEPNHLYSGMEWLQYGTYGAWPENPPLSRAIVAIGPYLQGFRIKPPATDLQTYWEYFFASFDLDYFMMGPIRENLFWMRISILPFFLLSVFVVWWWARSLGGKVAAFLAAGMYCTLPPILAHSGLATTDITFLTFFTLLLFCFARWLKRPSMKRGVLFGLSMGAALLMKFSLLAFFPAAALLMVILFWMYGVKEQEHTPKRWGKEALKSGTLALMLAFLCIWASFGFSVGTLGNEPVIRAAIQEGSIPAAQGEWVVPAPEWFAGLRLLMLHNAMGHTAYVAGEISMFGFWFYYPLTVLLKTPWPFLLFLILGAVGAWMPAESKKNWEVLALSLLPVVLIAAGLSSNINIGLRHMLVIYPLGAVGAGVGFLQLLKGLRPLTPAWKTGIPAALVFWQLGIALVAYPNYLSYFNANAGKEPGELLIDSDLDWGQGMFALAEFCRQNGVKDISMSVFGLGQDCWYGLPAVHSLPPDSLAQGWVAISEMAYRGVFGGTVFPMGDCNTLTIMPIFSEKFKANQGYRWLDKYPLKARLAGSIRVYYIDNKQVQPRPATLPGSVKQ